MPPVLFADRFYRARSGQSIDLATAEPVWIRPRSFESDEQRDGWLTRSAVLASLWHPHLVALADFGATSTGYFEAWACPPPPRAPWRRRGAATAAALRSVADLLRSQGIGVAGPRWAHVTTLAGRPALWPGDDDAGGEASAERRSDGLARWPGGCVGASGAAGRGRPGAIHTRATAGPDVSELVDRVSEMLDSGECGRPRAVRLAVPTGAERLAVLAVARGARLRGYVPVATRLLDRATQAGTGWREAIAGRHVLVLRVADDASVPDIALFFLGLALESDRPHVWLTLAGPASRGPARPREWRHGVTPARVREESAPYAAGAVVAPWSPTLAPPVEPAERSREPGEPTGIRRPAQAERWLRDTAGRCARRGDECGAGEATLALGRLLLLRGHTTEATESFTRARRHLELARLPERALLAGAFTGLALTDAGQFSEAEAALRAAAVAAASLGDRAAKVFALQGLARCLIWRGRPSEATDCLTEGRTCLARGAQDDDGRGLEWRRLAAPSCARDRLVRAAEARPGSALVVPACLVAPIDPAVTQSCLQTRAAVASGDLAAAGRASAEALAEAARSGRPVNLASACRARALLFTALGDVAAVRQQVEEGLDAARRARDPLRAVRLRLQLAEVLVAEGRSDEARALIARLARIDTRRLPAVVSRPLQRVVRGEPVHRAARLAAAFPSAPASTVPAPSLASRASLVDAVIDVLMVCQDVEDDRDALRKTAAAVRGRVRAASVACVAWDQEQAVVLANDGGAQPSEWVARRAAESGLVIPPSASRTGLEAAVPVRFAGTLIGAVACRWAADVPPDWPQAGALLAAASAAAGPCLRAAIDRRAAPTGDAASLEILGVSEAVRQLRADIARAAAAPFNVLVEGESGSGKELVARAMHRLGPRAHRPLCALNCAALTDDLVEAELFGHARGAFTGAIGERKGLFEEAHLGTLVLDEVGELTPRAQAKLLRALQEGEVRRLGENLPRAVDVRIVAASNRSLRGAAEAGVFRQDLLYRLEVIRIAVPPLRARVEDIPVLAARFWAEATARLGSRSTLAPSTLAALARYRWPGNVRELQNVMASLAVAAGRRGSIGPERLPEVIARQAPARRDARSLDEARRQFEAQFVREALARAGGRRAQAATDLGLTRQGLAKLMARLGLE